MTAVLATWIAAIALVTGLGLGSFVGWWAATGRAERAANDLYWDAYADGYRASREDFTLQARDRLRHHLDTGRRPA